MFRIDTHTHTHREQFRTIFTGLYMNSLTFRNPLHIETECVVPSVTVIAEHHFLLSSRVSTHPAGLTLQTLPGVGEGCFRRFTTHTQTGGVDCVWCVCASVCVIFARVCVYRSRSNRLFMCGVLYVCKRN